MKTKFRILSCITAIILTLSLLMSCMGGADTEGGGGSSGAGGEGEFSLSLVPEFSGKPYVKINGGTPYFTEDEITAEAFESYAELDQLKRCGVTFACVGLETMPTEDRGSIGNVRPSGWDYKGVSNNNKYSKELVDGQYIYNRCHLIGYQLTGENDNTRNLITGTRYLNIDGMLPFEDMVADYVKETGNHVMYRVTPIFEDYNAVATGVLIEGLSVEDAGRGIKFCTFAYNVQPGVEINYFTGENALSGTLPPPSEPSGPDADPDPEEDTVVYILNTNSKKYHTEDCSGVQTMKEENKLVFEGTKEAFGEEFSDYEPCGTCKPNE